MAINNKITFRVKDTDEDFHERLKKAIEPELVEAGIDVEQVKLTGIHVEGERGIADVEVGIKPR